jgi:hypothetical protein
MSDVPAGQLYLGEQIDASSRKRDEADLAEELTAIDDEWSAKAAAVETVDVPLEKSDIRVTARFLVWIPTS